jgi:hypothetical protein
MFLFKNYAVRNDAGCNFDDVHGKLSPMFAIKSFCISKVPIVKDEFKFKLKSNDFDSFNKKV